jgi:hypothetical protein
MTVEVIGRFKPINGVQTYRVNGSYDDLYKIIEELRKIEAVFGDTPLIHNLRKGQWTMLLKLVLPAELGTSLKATHINNTSGNNIPSGR